MPIVENPPLARALHATVEIDEEIPAEHYKAVAEVIGYVMRLRRAAARAAMTAVRIRRDAGTPRETRMTRKPLRPKALG